MTASTIRPFPETERALLLAVHNAGPRTVGYLEQIGISSLAELARQDAAILRLRINAMLGRPQINTLGQSVLAALIAAARAELNRQG